MAQPKLKARAPRSIALTADCVVFTMQRDDLAVLLVRRKHAPFEGAWALPGGFVDPGERLEKAAARELAEETGLRGVRLEQLGAFGDPGRDPRGHTVTVAFLAFTLAERSRVVAGDDAAHAAWVPLRELPIDGPIRARRGAKAPELAFDHATIIRAARERLRQRLDSPTQPTPFQLVPPRFTLAELRRVYELIFDRSFTAPAFKKRLVGGGFVVPVAEKEGATGRAALYCWASSAG